MIKQSIVDRSSTHVRLPSETRDEQRWLDGVTDLDVAVVMYAVETGACIRRMGNGRWTFPARSDYGRQLRVDLSVAVREMVRTGVLTHLIRRLPAGEVHLLVPALVHLRASTGLSACGVPGEGMGPKRVRLSDDLSLVDCLDCAAAG